MAPRPQCVVCNEVEGRYKCPRCLEYTCSVSCSREHRDNHPHMEPSAQLENTPKAVQPPQSVIEESPAGNTEPGSLKKSSIVDTPEYKMLLQNYPNLPELLSSIATATDPPAADNPSRSRKPWNRDIGMDNGVSALRKAKIAPGDDREAIREFSALVKLFRERNALEMGMDVKARKAREDAKIIKGLMEEEDGS